MERFLRVVVCGIATLGPIVGYGECAADTGPIWLSLGPEPVMPSAAVPEQGTLSPPVSGRAAVLAVNPKNRYNIWLGTASGGLWVSNNAHIGDLEAGDVKADPSDANFDRTWRPHWFPLNSGLESLSIGAVILDPAKCSASGCLGAYVGTGENSLRRDTYYGDGVYRVWYGGSVEFPQWNFDRLDTAEEFKYGSTAAMVLDGDELYVALSAGNTTTSVYASVKAPQPAAGYGVHRRKADGTWTKIFATTSNGKERWADLLLPTDLEKIPGVDGGFLLGVHNEGIFKTTDRGQTWCALNSGSRLVTASQNGTIPTSITDCSGGTGLPAAGTFDHVEISLASSDVVVALFGNCPSGYTETSQRATSLCRDGYATDRSPFLFKSSNGGGTWTSPGTLTGAHYSRYTHLLRAVNANQVLWGGLNPWLLNTDGAFSQGGLSQGSLHWDVHDIVGWGGWDSGGDVLYGATDGGFYVLFNGSWKPGNDSLITTAFVGIAIDYEDEPGDSYPRTTAILGGLQDNSNAAYNGSPKWHMWGPVGDGGEALIQTPTITVDSLQNNDLRRIPGFMGGFSYFIPGTRLGGEEDAAFYSPLVQHEETKRIFAATDVVSVREGLPDLWTTGMSAPQAVQISPVLGTDGNDYPAIETDRDWITALAVAPSHAWRVYAGLYSGKLWRSKTAANTQPTPTSADWMRIDSGLPARVISSIAVHPTDHKKLWVAFSDFIDQTVWYSDNEGASWTARSSGLAPGEPVKVIKVDPDSPAKLWLGTDTGVYHSKNGGQTWERRSANLPNVPVFDLEIDRHTKRIFAATHGRGVWMNTDEGPLLTTFEGWTDDGIWDIPIYGTGFTCSQSGGCDCSVDIEREDGVVCASGSKDAMDRRMYVANGDHLLRTDDVGSCTRCEGKPVVWACFNGDCVGGVPLNECNVNGHRVSVVKVQCEDNPLTTGGVAGSCPEQSNPPSNLFEVNPALTIPGSGGGGGAEAASPMSLSGAAGPVSVVLTPMVMASPANGGDHALCTALAEIQPDDAEPQVRLRDALNSSAACQAAGVHASLVQEVVSRGEDRPDRLDQRLALAAPMVKGAQLILSVGVPPGQAGGSCFTMSRLGVFLANQLAITQLHFPTTPAGALGGSVTVTEISPLGLCGMRIPTHAGQTSLEIAQALATAFQAPGVPSPATCAESANPRDIVQDGPSLVALLPTALRVCIEDAGIGFRFGPHGLNAEPPQIQIPGDVYLEAACVGATSTATLNVCNSGKGDLLVNPIVSSDPQITVTTPSSGYPVVISHDFCFPFQVKLEPTSKGSHTATLSVTSNDPLHPIVQVKATGEGLEPAISVSGSTDFGFGSAWSALHSLAEKELEICNRGGCPLEVTAASIDCADFTLIDSPVPTSLTPGSCTRLTVGFEPVLPGPKRCTLTVSSNDPASPSVSRELSGHSPPRMDVRVGVAQPHGGLTHALRQGSAFELGFRMPFRAHWAWSIALGNARLDGRSNSASHDFDLNIPSFAATARFTLNPASSWRVFLEGGPSVQHFNPGDFEAGADLALGLDVPLGRRFAVDGQYRYRWAWTARPDREISQLLLGLSTSF